MTTILHVIQQISLGGGTRTLLATAKASSRKGPFRHRVVSLVPGSPEAVALAKNAGVPVVNGADTASAIREMRGADIVQLEWWNSPEMQSLLRQDLPPMRLFIWYHVCGESAPQIITPELASLADLNVATNPWTARELPVFRDMPASLREQRVTCVIPGADFDRLKGLERKPHQGFNVGYIGSVDFVKMHRRYVPMSAAIRIPEARFVVCGAGSALSRLSEEARQLGASGRFEFRGFVSDIKPVIEILDVYGYPLCADTYASGELNLQEIMHAGVPPVVFPHGGIRGLIEHEKTGLVVSSEQEYRDAIEYLYHHPEVRQRLGASARDYASRHFGAENAAGELNRLYHQLLQLPKRPRLWGCAPDLPVWQQPVQLSDLLDTPPSAIGARLFAESLGRHNEDFLTSLTAPDASTLMAAEERIAQCSTLVRSPFSGGVLNYRNAFQSDGYLRLWSGLVLNQEGRLPEAIGEFGAALNSGCNHWRIHWYIAQAAARHGDLPLAEKAVRGVIHAQPGFEPARQLLSTLTEKNSPAGTDAPPTDAAGFVRLAQAAVEAGNIEEFETALARAMELEPEYPDALRLLAALNFQCGRFHDAAQICMRFLQRHAPDAPILLTLAACFANAGENEAARESYQHVLAMDPGNEIAKKALSELQTHLAVSTNVSAKA